LSEKRDILYDQSVICSEADFDSTWDSYLQDYLDAGGQAIIDERTAKWEATFGDSDMLPE
jgi:putative aldouronate transport system substrate-binding protein